MLLNQLILGLSIGSIYSLAALGLVFVYKVTKVVNFAFGNMGMFMVYVAYSLIALKINPLVALLIILPLSALFGYVVEKFTIRPLKKLSHGSMLIITLGILMILEGLALQLWGTDYKGFPEIVKGRPIIFRGSFGILIFRKQDILIFSILISIALVLFMLLKYTKIGIAIRAVAENDEIAQLMGINSNAIAASSWMVSVSLAALIAFLVAPKTYVSPAMMLYYQIEGFTAAVLGGFESFTGAILGGLILGILENFVATYISVELKVTFSLLLIVLILFIRPEGIFGRTKVEKV
jgi:branched-chain amino acid transport system permease protein